LKSNVDARLLLGELDDPTPDEEDASALTDAT
jgi:hypothetical protein